MEHRSSFREKLQLEKADQFFRKCWSFVKKHEMGFLGGFAIIGMTFGISSILNKDDNVVIKKDISAETQSIDNDCNILSIEIAGAITSNGINSSDSFFSSDGDTVYSDYVKQQLDTAKNNDKIKAVLLSINSYGGEAGSAQEIVYALDNLGKPSVAIIRSVGVSAAYWIATKADKIYAYETADVGGIGVTMSHLDETAVNTKDGKFFVSLSVGKFKDMGNPDKSLTAEEKILFMRDINDAYDIFIKQVATGRKISIEKVRELADGSSMIAGRAKEKGLIDEVGSTYNAIDYLSEVIGEKAEVCVVNDEEQ